MLDLQNDDFSLKQAAQFLKNGSIVAFPTETVYGLGVSLYDNSAVNKLYNLKKRSHDKPFTAHIAELSQVHEIAQELPDEFFLLAEKYWPGPLTLVVKKSPQVSSLVTGGLDSIGIRMPSHDIALKLLQFVGFPIAATSANISGQPCIQEKEILLQEFPEITAFVNGNPKPLGIASTVVSLIDPKNPQILRQGLIRLNDLQWGRACIPADDGMDPALKKM